MTDPAPITQDGTTVVIGGDGVRLLYRAVFACACDSTASWHHRPLLNQALTTLYRACMSPTRHPLDTTAPAPASCNGQHGDLIGIAQAAEVLPDGGPF